MVLRPRPDLNAAGREQKNRQKYEKTFHAEISIEHDCKVSRKREKANAGTKTLFLRKKKGFTIEFDVFIGYIESCFVRE